MSTQRIDARRWLAALAGALLVLALWAAAQAEPVIVYTRLDGGLSVVSPVPALVMEFHRFGRPTGTLTWTGPPVADLTGSVMSLAQAEAAALAFIRGDAIPADATDVAVVDRATLPASRKFRNAWVRAGPGVGVDMPSARAIHATQVRAEARKRLVKSAEDQASAEDAGDAARAAAHRAYQGQVRALLRSLEADLAALATPEALAAWPPVWPADPGGP